MSSTVEPDWLSVRNALLRIVAAVGPVGSEELPLLECLGRVIAQDAVAPVDQPPWRNSSMDGFAVRAADVVGAAPDHPALLNVVDRIAAGGFPVRDIGAGEAAGVMTGAPLPDSADTVIRIEHTRVSGRGVEVLDATDAYRNVRARAEDLHAGATAIAQGRVLRAAEIGVLSSVLLERVRVTRRPRVAILSTGDELAGFEDRAEVLAGRRIVNSNSYALAAAVLEAGAEPVLLGIARDQPESLRAHLERARDADVIITSAGASVGERDLVKDVLRQMGFILDFWRVRMKPGSPFSFGTLGGKPVFSLPGNPVSALVTFHVLVRPALRRMLGEAGLYPARLPVRAATAVPTAGRLVHFVRAVLDGAGDDVMGRPTGPQGSGILGSMAAADVLLVVPPGAGDIPPGRTLGAITVRGGAGTSAHPDFLSGTEEEVLL